MGFWNEFMDTHVEFIGVEAGGPKNSKLHAAPLTNRSKIGILHGAAQYVVQDKEGQIGLTESISAGLDYPGISPLHCFLKDAKRARYTSASDEEALQAYQLVSKLENISPSLEPSHAFAEAIKIAPKLKPSEILIINSCGDSLKDQDIIKKRLGSYIR
jgi:tryptophan synthase beta subunit